MPRFSRSLMVALIAIGIIVLAGGWYLLGGRSDHPEFDPSSYQAVFLTNNQVYFGKLSGLGTRYPELTDVYYIQAFAAQDLAALNKAGSQLQLVKLGSELHQPQDVMYLNRDQILFIELLKPDSQIVSSIARFEQAK